MTHRFSVLASLSLLGLVILPTEAVEEQPHAVFVIGTTHYSPERTIPQLAEQLEGFGFRTTVVSSDSNPERKPNGLPGLEALETADVAIFYARFLTLPDAQLRHVTDYLESGRPVVGFRTSTHAFGYPKNDPRSAWNNNFGSRALGSRYFVHLQGDTEVSVPQTARKHAVFSGVRVTKDWIADGSLYLSDIPDDATVLMTGRGHTSKPGTRTNPFGTHVLKETMTDDVAWTWENEWGGRVFTTTLGHPETFTDRHFVRFFLNGICWAADQQPPKGAKARPIVQQLPGGVRSANRKDARNTSTGKAAPKEDPDYQKYGIYAESAPRAKQATPVATTLPLQVSKGARIALVGNTLIERAQFFGYFESMLHQRYPEHELVIRNLGWAADTPDLQPRPANFADQEQHLTHEKADIIFAAYGFNESFAGTEGVEAWKTTLSGWLKNLKSKAYNGTNAPRIVLISPIACEDIKGVSAAAENNSNVSLYVQAMQEVAVEHNVGFADVFSDTLKAMSDPETDLTLNGVHLLEEGYEVFGRVLYRQVFDEDASAVNQKLRASIIDKNRHYFRRYRPLNTFYYTGGRRKSYGYLDFLPAMKNFDIMAANRDRQSWDLARPNGTRGKLDDSNVPELPDTKESRGANRWMSAVDEQKSFDVDPRFEVNLFAGEEEFPDIAAPIQMRWDSRGRLWVSCSTTYPHVYPGNEPNDKLVILEDTDGDGKADTSTVFADDLHIPLSFEFGDGGVYVSEMPHLTFLKDTDGDGKADFRQELLTGFGTEDSHHSLHDFAWTPDGDLIFRESIFHHSQVETPYGPVRQQNSGWFRFDPDTHRLTSFGTYHSTNPWGVTFDHWGQHMASHPIYAAAFHSLDPPFPQQHAKPAGLQAYSGTCGQEFVDFGTFPDELQGAFIKARYKPTNRIEILRWHQGPFGFKEEYVSDLIFSRNLSFIPVDLRYGPRGAMYVCDWYNPVKGHAQYSLRDDRRDRHSGRIWRITTKGKTLQPLPKIHDASIQELLDTLKRPEYRIRYLAKRELRDRDTNKVSAALEQWLKNLAPSEPGYRHHQLEGVWMCRNVRSNGRGTVDKSSLSVTGRSVLRQLLSCDEPLARAAAVEQLRFWHSEFADIYDLLGTAANDENGIVRMQAAIACSYVGTPEALDVVLQTLNHPADQHLAYAIQCSLNSHTLQRHWTKNDRYNIAGILRKLKRSSVLKEPTPSASQAEFDTQENLTTVRISCVPERMLFTQTQFTVAPGSPLKLVFTNPDATDHNLVFVKPDALAEVGMAANAMARDPKFAQSDFIPAEKKHLILQATPMIGPTRKSLVHVLRFNTPEEPGIYPFVCTFPGHWVIMNGQMIVAGSAAEAEALIAASKPAIVRKWKLADLNNLKTSSEEQTLMRGMQAFVKARCNQCHAVAGHGINLGPDLTDVVKRYKGQKLVQQIVDPSSEINKKYLNHQIVLKSGKVVSGVIVQETPGELKVVTNLLNPNGFTRVARKDIEEMLPSTVSAMPQGLVDVLTKKEIADLASFLENAASLPKHLQHHDHGSQ